MGYEQDYWRLSRLTRVCHPRRRTLERLVQVAGKPKEGLNWVLGRRFLDRCNSRFGELGWLRFTADLCSISRCGGSRPCDSKGIPSAILQSWERLARVLVLAVIMVSRFTAASTTAVIVLLVFLGPNILQKHLLVEAGRQFFGPIPKQKNPRCFQSTSRRCVCVCFHMDLFHVPFQKEALAFGPQDLGWAWDTRFQ